MQNIDDDITNLKAPREDFSCLIHPPLPTQEAWLGDLVADGYDQKWQQRRKKARLEILKEACELDYVLAQSRGEDLTSDQVFPKNRDIRLDIPWIVTGHQPEFIHPGVWLKNYFTATLAKQNHAYSLNIIVEHDEIKHTQLSYPQFDPKMKRVVEKKHTFTTADPTTCWEFAPGKEVAETEEFLDDIRQETANYPHKSLLAELSIEEVDHYGWGTITLPDWMLALRKAAELHMGFCNHEVPTGNCCDTESFLEFFLEIVVSHQEFHQLYNQNLARHRIKHKLKNSAQPLPDLVYTEGWFELPFWLVHSTRKSREPLFVKLEAEHYLIKGKTKDLIKFPAQHKTLTGLMVKLKSSLLPSQYKLRPRALTLTMFARMFLADLFIHGLGGGKYDLLTNEIIRKFYGLEPTPFSIVTGTCFLPFHKQKIKPLKELQATRDQLLFNLRKAKLQPETCFEETNINPKLNSMLEEIARLKRIMQDRHWGPRIHLSKSARVKQKDYYQQAYLKLKSLRTQLLPHAHSKIAEHQLKLTEFTQELHNQQLMHKREYPAFLYPQKTLQKFFEQALPTTD